MAGGGGKNSWGEKKEEGSKKEGIKKEGGKKEEGSRKEGAELERPGLGRILPVINVNLSRVR